MVLFDIENHEKEILEVGYENKKIESKDKWNQLKVLDVQYLLGTNRCMTLLHMSNIYIWIEETNQLINGFSIGYMMNPKFHKNKAFK